MTDDIDEPTPDDVATALAALGSEPVVISEERLAALEARVLGDRTERRPNVAVVVPAVVLEAGRRRRPRRAIQMVSVAATLFVCVLAFGLLAADDDGLVIADAAGVTVALPGGDEVQGRAGTALPEGADLEVAEFVVVDGRRFGPGRYRVADGELVAETGNASTVTSSVPGTNGNVETVPASTAPSATTSATTTSEPDEAIVPARTTVPVRDTETETESTVVDADGVRPASPARPVDTPSSTRPTSTSTTTTSTTTTSATTTSPEQVRDPVRPTVSTTTTSTSTTTTTSSVPPVTRPTRTTIAVRSTVADATSAPQADR
ncbi:MAG: hypothetical protein AB8G14_14010 [Ilumatobacter sp.]